MLVMQPKLLCKQMVPSINHHYTTLHIPRLVWYPLDLKEEREMKWKMQQAPAEKCNEMSKLMSSDNPPLHWTTARMSSGKCNFMFLQ